MVVRDDLILLDTGSTIIKGLRFGPGDKVESYFRTRDKGGVSEQAIPLMDKMKGDRPASVTRICSSANGGLNIGVLCLSIRISGNITMRVLESVGANIRYMVTWDKAAGVEDQLPVDMLIIVGGIDAFPWRKAANQFQNIDLKPFTFDRLIYAGHRHMVEAARAKWSEITILENMLTHSLKPANDQLPTTIRDGYLEDIQSKREILPLQEYSELAIAPTPAVVSRSFARLQTRFLTPAVLFDIGGATTDLHFTRELLDDRLVDCGSSAYPETARHVYTAFGVSASRHSTLRALVADHHCGDLLYEIYGDAHRTIYAELLEDAVEVKLLFVACIFLVLRNIVDRRDGSPSLNLGQIATIALTGGASQLIGEAEIQATFRAVFGRETHAEIAIDRDYRWWTLGLLKQDELDESVWKACHV
ncbi:MAG: glutamate mutase L [Alphaproteobacteria bacterium]|nr:glutamate mutase L [Alphaproteobacteria bacterium]